MRIIENKISGRFRKKERRNRKEKQTSKLHYNIEASLIDLGPIYKLKNCAVTGQLRSSIFFFSPSFRTTSNEIANCVQKIIVKKK